MHLLLRVLAPVMFLQPSVASAAPVTVRWADVVRAIDHHPRLAASQARIAAATFGMDAAAALPNPTLNVGVGTGVAHDDSTRRLEWEAELELPLSWLYGRGPQMAGAAAELAKVRSARDSQQREVIQRVTALFWRLAVAQERAAALTTQAAQAEELNRTVAARVDAGQDRPIALTRVEVELERIRAARDMAQATLTALGRQLALWLELPAGQLVVVQAEVESIPAVPELDAALGQAVSASPATASATAAVQAQQALVSQEQRARLPELNLVATAASELDRRAYRGGVSLELPLWNLNGAAIAQAEQSLVAAQRERAAVARDLEGMLIATHAACRGRAAVARRYISEIQPRADRAATTTTRSYRLGEAALLEVLDAQRTVLTTRRDTLDAILAAQLSCRRLTIMLGETTQ